MKIHPFLALAMVPAALVAQAPAPVDYMSVFKTQSPAVEGMLKDFQPVLALEKAESLLPAALPVFDKSNPMAGNKSFLSFTGLTRLYLLAGNAAVSAGEWEKYIEYYTKAQDCAKANYEGIKEVLTPVIDNWTKAVEDSKKLLAENQDKVAAIKAKPVRTPQEEQEYQGFVAKNELYNTTKNKKEKDEAATFLKANMPRAKELEAKALTPQEEGLLKDCQVAEGNVKNGPVTIKALQERIDAAKADAEFPGPKIEIMKKTLKEEETEATKALAEFKVKGKLVKDTSGPKFEEKKALYLEENLKSKKNYEDRPTKTEKLNFLFRLRHKVLGTGLQSKADEVIARVRADQDPLGADKKGGKGKKAK